MSKIDSLNENLKRMIVYSLYGAVFFMPLDGEIGALLIWLGLSFSLSRMVFLRRFEWKKTAAAWAIAGFFVWSFLSIKNSLVPSFSLYNWEYYVCSYVALYVLLVTYVESEEERNRILWFTFAGGAGACLFGIYQYVHLSNIDAMDWVDPEQFPLLRRRMYSTLQNPNLFGEYLMMLLGLLMPAVLREKKGRMIYISLGVLFFFCMLLTYSRGIWVSFACMVLFLGVVVERRLLFSLLAIPGVLFFYQGEIAHRLWSLFSTDDTSVSLRYALWDSTSYMIRDYPIFGIGWGSFWQMYPWYNYFIQDPKVIIFHAHNMYLHLAAEIGVVGLCFFLAIVIIHGKQAFGERKNELEPPAWKCYGVPCVIVGVLVSSLFDHNLFSFQVSAVFWEIMALSVLPTILPRENA